MRHNGIILPRASPDRFKDPCLKQIGTRLYPPRPISRAARYSINALAWLLTGAALFLYLDLRSRAAKPKFKKLAAVNLAEMNFHAVIAWAAGTNRELREFRRELSASANSILAEERLSETFRKINEDLKSAAGATVLWRVPFKTAAADAIELQFLWPELGQEEPPFLAIAYVSDTTRADTPLATVIERHTLGQHDFCQIRFDPPIIEADVSRIRKHRELPLEAQIRRAALLEPGYIFIELGDVQIEIP